MLSKISYFHCRTFFIHQPRKKLKYQIFRSVTKISPNLCNHHLSSCAAHVNDPCGQEQHPNSFDNRFCALTGRLRSLLQHVQPAQECRACLFLRACLSQLLANHRELAKYGGRGQVQTSPAICQSLSCYQIMDRFVCNFE